MRLNIKGAVDLGVVSLIPARSHTIVEIDHEIISMDIFLLLLIQEWLFLVTKEKNKLKVLVNRFVKLAKGKVW